MAYYVGTQPDQDGLAKILDQFAQDGGLAPLIQEETPLEVVRRVKDGTEFWFILNLTGQPQPAPESFRGETDVLTGEAVGGQLKPFDALLVKR